MTISRTICWSRGSRRSCHMWRYTRVRSAWSYNIFSKWGTSHFSSTLYRENPPPMWSYIPPAAMASSEIRTVSTRLSSPFNNDTRSSRSSANVDGNFGAPPKPPHVLSKDDCNDPTVVDTSWRASTLSAGETNAVRPMASSSASTFC